eukprot:2155908-Pyramimonas_sp.AAC.1
MARPACDPAGTHRVDSLSGTGSAAVDVLEDGADLGQIWGPSGAPDPAMPALARASDADNETPSPC